MKEILLAVRAMSVMMVIVCIVFMMTQEFANITGETRTSAGVIRMVRGSEVQIETADGEVWSAYATDLEVGDHVRVVFNTNRTPVLLDDEIAAVVR